MKVKCIESKCDWFTQGREYAAMVGENEIAILQDNMCSDLSENNDHWIARKSKLRGIAGEFFIIGQYHAFVMRNLAAFEVVK